MTRALAILAAACLGLIAAEAKAAAFDRPVMTASGAVQGVEEGAGLHVFKGMPFAAPPVGQLRWREPQTPAHWTGVRAANKFSPSCPQKGRDPNSFSYRPIEDTQAEDCLYLNVWTPAKTGGAKLPVMVWIYGGGFQNGSGGNPSYDGANLARHGVVLVTFNYRLGALGYLVHPELTRESPHKTSGNYGMLDQIAALKWVKANIAAFGGDPARVTIFGESAGSGSVNILHASPLAKGLFQRAIGESTSQMDPAGGIIGRRSMAQSEEAGVKYAAEVGAHSLAELRALPFETLTKSPTQFWPQEKDGYLLPDEVHAIFAAGRQNRIALISGSNSTEGANIRVPWVRPDASEKAGYDRLYANAPETQVYTDVVQWQNRTWARLHARSGAGPAYVYWFDQAPPVPLGRYRENGGKAPGAYHSAEIQYVFGTLAVQPSWPWTDTDRKLSDTMMRYWTNFARTGDPNGAGLPAWPRYDDVRPEVMHLAKDVAAGPPSRPEAQSFLDAYFDKRR